MQKQLISVMNYTTIEQSKKLLELGLKPDTADMYWMDWKRDTNSITIPNIKGVIDEKDLPCWSAGALMDLLPTTIWNEDTEDSFDLFFTKDNDTEYSISYYNDYENPFAEYGGLIDTLVKTIEWLLINKYI